jgi:predicted nucleotidyltransferase component of viral defense system
MSREELLKSAKENAYKPEMLEKVLILLEVMNDFTMIPYLRDRLVLKGGTALNVFQFNDLPRLSVDIDLNYIGQLNREAMLEERPIINDAIFKTLVQKKFTLDRNPGHYAGGKMVWRYDSALGQKGNLEIDLNYMYRQPLLDIEWKEPHLISQKAFKTPVLDIHELAAGKLSALFARRTSRDLFDAHYLFKNNLMSLEKLKPILIAYFSMTDVPIKNFTPLSISHELADVYSQLLPLLKQNSFPTNRKETNEWIIIMVEELKDMLYSILPLSKSDINFIEGVRLHGKITPSFLTQDEILATRIQNHPAICWAAKKTKM